MDGHDAVLSVLPKKSSIGLSLVVSLVSVKMNVIFSFDFFELLKEHLEVTLVL